MSRPLYTRATMWGVIAVFNAAVLGTGAAAAAAARPVATGTTPAVASRPAPRIIAALSVPAAVARTPKTAPAPRPVAAARKQTARPQPTAGVARSRRTTRPARPRAAAAAPRPRAAIRPTASSWSTQLSEAIARIPRYQRGDATWVVSDAYGHWGTADWYHSTAYVSPRVPSARLYDVVVHEWSHLLSVTPYGGDVDAAVQAMSAYFGGSGLTGAERAADCMALEQGATWTHYTSCEDNSWRAGAARLINGDRL